MDVLRLVCLLERTQHMIAVWKKAESKGCALAAWIDEAFNDLAAVLGQHARDAPILKGVFRAGYDKLNAVRAKNPSTAFFHACRALDPARIVRIPQSLDNYYPDLPAMSKTDKATLYTEWAIYCSEAKTYVAAAEEVKAAAAAIEEKKGKKTVLQQDPLFFWWTSMASRLPTLSPIALRCLSVPVTSCHVERSFSKYRQILSDDRQSLSESNIATMMCISANPSLFD
jgi:hypothetical protein